MAKIRALAVTAALTVCVAGVNAEPIDSIFVSPPPIGANLQYHYDEKGDFLTAESDSFTVLIERVIGGIKTPEFIHDASFSMTASGLTDTSVGGLASGVFSRLNFVLRDSDETILLSGNIESGANLVYAESTLASTMLMVSGEIPITAGELAADFDIAAIINGLGYLISPSTTSIDALDQDHGGAFFLSLNAVPEPATLGFLVLAGIGALGRRRIQSR